MPRKVFFSYHYKADHPRAELVRKLAVVNGNEPAPGDQWKVIRNSGDEAIRCWIDDHLRGRTCTVVLVGPSTANRKWVRYEVQRSWQMGCGVIGIHVHNLRNGKDQKSAKGRNPFLSMIVDGVYLGSIVPCYDPPFTSTKKVTDYITDNLENWVESAMEQRQRFG